MQSQVSQRQNRDKTSSANPVDGHFCNGVLILTDFSSSFELQQGRTGFRASQLAGFNVRLALEPRASEVDTSDSASGQSGWTRGRPAHEFSISPNCCETELGFEAPYGRPVRDEDSKWICDDQSVLIEANSWLDKKQPHGNVKKSESTYQTWQVIDGVCSEYRNNGTQVNQGCSDYGVASNARANDFHCAYYPSDFFETDKKCEATK
jgi:hypothetical protein